MTQMLDTTTYTAQEVAALVQECLTPYQPFDAPLEVLPKAVHQEGRWWYVVVPPSRSITSASDYSRLVEKVQRDLRKRNNLLVSILPVVPGWMNTNK